MPPRTRLGAGYTGQITANSFMKREFGKKLIEEFFPTVDLTTSSTPPAPTSRATAPDGRSSSGGAAQPSRRDAVRAVLGVRGEPQQPADPEKGLVWTAIAAQVEQPGSESEWVSVVDLPRARLT